MSNGLSFPVYLETASAEAAIVGFALLSPSVIDRYSLDLSASEFLVDVYSEAWQALCDLRADSEHIDDVTVAARMTAGDAAKCLQNCVDAAYASQVAGIPGYIKVIREGAQRASWQLAARCLAEAVITNDEALVSRAERHLAAPTSITEDTADPEHVGHAVVDFLEDNKPVGIPTGLVALDNRIGGGLRPGDTTALGGWTGMGKSCLVDQLLTSAYEQSRTAHAYVNEMSLVDRGLRMLARATGVPHSQLVLRDVNPADTPRLIEAAGRLPFGITDCSQWTADQIARHIRVNRWDLCAVDLLHNIPYERESELHRITATLAAAARSSGTHLILVCQLNEERAKTTKLPDPVIRDIRGSGMIKNLSANVLFVHRQQVVDKGIVFTTNDATVTAGKARHGQPGAALATFNPERMSFDPAHLRPAA